MTHDALLVHDSGCFIAANRCRVARTRATGAGRLNDDAHVFRSHEPLTAHRR